MAAVLAWGGARWDSIGRNRIARSWQDPMGRVAADGEAGADYASHTEGGGRGYELVTVGPDKSNRGLLGCQATFVEKNPYETRNTNLISLDVATKL